MTPTEIKQTLSQLGGVANKRLGQHFLIDRSALETIVEHAHLHPGAVVLEIGPGLGVLTRALLEAGANVIAIERDRRFFEYLNGSTRVAQEGRASGSSLQVVQGDATELEWEKMIGDREWSFVSNLPYSITSFALRKALWSLRPPENIVVLVQREVAERVIARDGKGSLLSLMVALASFEFRIIRRVPAGAFFPPPKVESAILQIVPMSWSERQEKWGVDSEKIMEVAKAGFAHPRKLLASNLKSLVGACGARPLSSPSAIMQEIGISEKARAEELLPEDWARLTCEILKVM